MWQNIDTYSFDESLHLRLVGAKSVQKGLQGIDGISADLALSRELHVLLGCGGRKSDANKSKSKNDLHCGSV